MAKSHGVELQRCWRCNGTGEYIVGPIINGVGRHLGPCFKCIGGGEFPVTSGAAWFTRYGARILKSVETMARAGGESIAPGAAS